LKLDAAVNARYVHHRRSQPTYEDLKHRITSYAIIGTDSSQPTYEDLKLYLKDDQVTEGYFKFAAYLRGFET